MHTIDSEIELTESELVQQLRREVAEANGMLAGSACDRLFCELQLVFQIAFCIEVEPRIVIEGMVSDLMPRGGDGCDRFPIYPQ